MSVALLPVPAASREGARAPERRGGGRVARAGTGVGEAVSVHGRCLPRSLPCAALCSEWFVADRPLLSAANPKAGSVVFLSGKEGKCSSAWQLTSRSLDAMVILDLSFFFNCYQVCHFTSPKITGVQSFVFLLPKS